MSDVQLKRIADALEFIATYLSTPLVAVELEPKSEPKVDALWVINGLETMSTEDFRFDNYRRERVVVSLAYLEDQSPHFATMDEGEKSG